MSLLVVGSIALDDVQTPFGKVERSLGGSAIYASMISKNFIQTNIVGIVGKDFPKEYFDLLDKNNINTKDIKVVPGKTFHWSGVYNDMNRAETIDTQLNVFADFDPQLCEDNRNCEYLFLGNIDPDLQLNVLTQMKRPKLIACDTMNFWIAGSRLKLLEVISKVNILFINEDELRMLTNEKNIFQAAQRALEYGPEYVIVKRGEYGAFAYSENYIFFMPAFPVRKVMDPTGAGDSFAGGFMGYLASCDTVNNEMIKKAMMYGTVAASFNVESFSVDRLKKISKHEILKRQKVLEKYMKF